MARIRSIKPEFWVSEQVAECSTSARLTFVGLWTFSDDNGVHPAKPKTLKAELFPMDDVSSIDVAGWMAELINAGLVAEFEAGGERFWYVTGWAKHQKIDRPSCKYPVPPRQTAPADKSVGIVEPSSKTQPSAAPDVPIAQLQLVEPSPNDRRAPPPGEERKGEERTGETASPKAQRSTPAESAGTRLPKDWALPDDWRRYCVDRRPELDPDAVAENFRDWWHGKAGKDGRKADWLATWQGWVRKERADCAPKSQRRVLNDDFVFGAQA